MVQLAGFAAVNEQPLDQAADLTATLEAQEGVVVDGYEEALRFIRAQDFSSAEGCFRAVLNDPLVQARSTEQLQRIAFLSLKNLANLIAKRPESAIEALTLYQQAVDIDDTDVVIWDKLGSLAAKQGCWSEARQALAKGLSLDPTHPTLPDKLMQLCVHLGDTSTATALAKLLLRQREHHALAAQIVKSNGSLEINIQNGGLLKLPEVSSLRQHIDERGYDKQASVLNITECSWKGVLDACHKSLVKATTAKTPTPIYVRVNLPTPAALLPPVVAPPVVQQQQQLTMNPAMLAQPLGAFGGQMAMMMQHLQQQQSALYASAFQPVVPLQAPAAAAVVVPPVAAPMDVEQQAAATTVTKPAEAKKPVAPTRSTNRKRKKKVLDIVESITAQPATNNTAPVEEEEAEKFYLLQILAPLVKACSANKPTTTAMDVDATNTTEVDDAAPNTTTTTNNNSTEQPSLDVYRFVTSLPSSIEIMDLSWKVVDQILQIASTDTSIFNMATNEALVQVMWLLQGDSMQLGRTISPASALLLGELFADIAVLKAIQSQQPSTDTRTAGRRPAAVLAAASVEQLARCGLLWLSRYRSGVLNQSFGDDGGLNTSSQKSEEDECRYWWSRGRLCESLGAAEEASDCYKKCDVIMDHVAGDVVVVSHLSLDSKINAAAIKGKVEVLQLSSVIKKAEAMIGQPASQNTDDDATDGEPTATAPTTKEQAQQAINLLAPVVFTCDKREALMARMDRSKWMHGLGLLLRLSGITNDLVMMYKCHLRLMHTVLPGIIPAWKTMIDTGDDSIELPEPEHTTLTHYMEHCIHQDMAAVLAECAVFLTTQGKELLSLVSSSSSSASMHSMEWDMIHSTVEKLLCCLQVCVLSKWLERGMHAARATFLSTKSNAARLVMSDAAISFVSLLELGQNDAGSLAPETVLSVFRTLCEALGDAGALTVRQGMFLTVSMRRIKDALSSVQQEQPSSSRYPNRRRPSKEEEDDEEEDVAAGLTAGLHHCIYWLYGPRLPGLEDEVWGGSAAPDESTTAVTLPLKKLASRESAFEIWELISEFLLQQTPAVLKSKYKDIVEDIYRHFPPPGPILQLSSEVWKNLESQQPPEIGVVTPENPMTDVIQQAKRGEASTPLDSDFDQYIAVYKTLYHLRVIMHPNLEDHLKARGNTLMIDPTSDAVLEDLLRPCKVDLCFNPDRFMDGWVYIAGAYHEAAELLMVQAAEQMSVSQWKQRPDLQQRILRYRRLGYWSEAISAGYTPEPDDIVDIIEDSGERCYSDVQDAPPLYDQFMNRSDPSSDTFQATCKSSLGAYTNAAERLPEEWVFQLRIGQCMKLLGDVPTKYLPKYGLACHLATTFADGMLDAVYALHAERLNLVIHHRTDATVEESLTAAGMYCFTTEAQDVFTAHKKDLNGSNKRAKADAITKVEAAMLKDCLAAMQWCLSHDKFYHPAIYSSAVAKYHIDTDNASEAINELAFMFTKPNKDAFCINVYRVLERSGTQGAARQKQGKKDRAVAAASEAHTSARKGGLNVPEAEYGFPPTTNNNAIAIGLTETLRSFWAQLRQSLELYLRLLAVDGQIDRLNSALNYLQHSKEGNLKPLADVARLGRGYLVLALLIKTQNDICPLERLVGDDNADGNDDNTGSKEMHDRLQSLAKELFDDDTDSKKKMEAILQVCYQVYIEHTLLRDSAVEQGNWHQTIIKPSLDALALDQIKGLLAGPSITGSTSVGTDLLPHSGLVLKLYSELYLHVLALKADGHEKIRLLNVAFKRKYKSLKLTSSKEAHAHGTLLMQCALTSLTKEVDQLFEEAIKLKPELEAPAPVAPVTETQVKHQEKSKQVSMLTEELTLLQQRNAELVQQSQTEYTSKELPIPDDMQQQIKELEEQRIQKAKEIQAINDECLKLQQHITREKQAAMDIDLPTVITVPCSAEGIELQEKIINSLKSVVPCQKSINYVQGVAQPAVYDGLVQQGDELAARLLRIYKVIGGHTDRPLGSASEVIKACDELIKEQRRQSRAAAEAAATAAQQAQLLQEAAKAQQRKRGRASVDGGAEDGEQQEGGDGPYAKKQAGDNTA